MSSSEKVYVLQNWDYLEGESDGDKKKTAIVKRPTGSIFRDLLNLLNKKHKVLVAVCGIPTYVGKDGVAKSFTKAADFFGWVESLGIATSWKESGEMLKKSEFLAACSNLLPQYKGVEVEPHIPAYKNYYYAKEPQVKPPTGRLDDLVDLWHPYTEYDRALIKAAFCTPFWGGPAGKRPAIFVEKGSPTDPGQGIGKTSLSDSISDISGGYIDHDMARNGAEKLTKRILNNGQGNRVIRCDNVKASMLSDAAVEGLITSPYISGYKLWAGEGKVDNRFTWLFTMNGGQLSRDLCERAIRVKLGRAPERDVTWDVRRERLISEHRGDIVNDILHILSQPAREFKTVIRFSLWQSQVLSKICNSESLMTEILNRQEEVDGASEDGLDLIEFFAMKIANYTYKSKHRDREKCKPFEHTYLIPKSVAAQWYQEMVGKKLPTRSATMAIERCAGKYLGAHKVLGVRYWVWATARSLNNLYALKITTETGWDAQEHEFRSSNCPETPVVPCDDMEASL